jgi:hypothetical protein
MATDASALESLPKEILLAIFAKVDFSKESLMRLRLVNQGFNNLLIHHQSILYDIAVNQFPQAFFASQYPGQSVPFSSNPKHLSMTRLKTFQESTAEIDAFISEIEEVRDSMIEKNGPQNYLATAGWKENLSAGLHLFQRMKASVGGEKCMNGQVWAHIHSTFLPRQAFVSFLPIIACPHMRHTSLMLLEIQQFLDNTGNSRRGHNREHTPYPERYLRMGMEVVLFQSHNLDTYVLSKQDRNRAHPNHDRHKGWQYFAHQTRTLWHREKEQGPAFEYKRRRYDQLLSNKIRGFLEAWDAEAPRCLGALHNLRVEGSPYDESAARKMVETFLDGL